MRKARFDGRIIPFILYYAVVYMSIATFSPYITLYYQGLGYSMGQIGMLTALGALVSVASQPLWGLLSDRTDKKRVLIGILAGAVFITLLYALKTTFMYIGMMVVLYNLFNSSATPLGDALTLQYIEKRQVKFSSIRLVGTISYAVMAAVVGQLLTADIKRLFPLNAVLLGMALFMVLWMPVEKKAAPASTGDLSQNGASGRGSLRALVQNKLVLCVFISAFVIGLTTTFYHSFIGIRMKELGADTGQVGLAMLIAAASEIPVLLFINKIFGRMKPFSLLIFSGLALGVRMFLLYTSVSVPMVYAVQLLHGISFMVPYYFSITLLNAHAPAHLKSTAQSVYAVCRSGLAALVGTVGGGFLAEAVGIRNVYWVLSAFVVTACCLVPGALMLVYRMKKKKGRSETDTAL